MAVTEQSIALRAMELLHLSEVELPRLVSLLPIARRKLALAVISDPRHEAFRASYDLTMTGGEVSLVSVLSATEPLLIETVRLADIFSASSPYKWQWSASRSLLLLQTQADFIHYTLEASIIVTDAPDATATMVAGFDPSLATVEAEGLDDELVTMLAMIGVKEQAAA